MTQQKSIAIIGAGISGLTAAIELASKGFRVTVFEKNEQFGGRGGILKKNGFMFDCGPSWYWMPDIFEEFFKKHGHSTSDYFDLKRLDPSFRIFSDKEFMDVPAGRASCLELFEQREKGSSKFLNKFLDEGQYKYQTGMRDFVRKPSLKWSEYFDWRLLKGLMRLEMLKSLETVVHRGIKDPILRQWMCFPVLFLGAKPSRTPALYSLMNYAEIELGTWYPMGGMIKLFESLYQIAMDRGVLFEFNSSVDKIEVLEQKATGVKINGLKHQTDVVLSTADYQHTDQVLLDPPNRQYSEQYWNTRLMAPSAMVFYIGIDRKVEGLLHHNLFFDEPFDRHASAIYDVPDWPSDPLFYVCVPSKTDPTVAPQGMENLFILIPLAAGLEDNSLHRENLFQKVFQRIQKKIGINLIPHVIVREEMGPKDFKSVYNSYKGNAYGLANTLRQTAVLKPRLKHSRVEGLFFAGQLSHPGPGLPPSLISGQISAELILKYLNP